MAVAERKTPGVSLLQLRELYEDYPTIPLALAMCEQASAKLTSDRDLIRAMYQVPSARDPRTWIEEQLTYRHRMLLEVAVGRWLKKGAV